MDKTIDKLISILLSFGFWSTIYLVSRVIAPHRNPEYCSRISALLHGLIMSICGTNQCFVGNSVLGSTEEASTKTQELLIITSLGYFIEDLSWCLYYDTETALMIAHHIYSCFTLMRTLFKGSSGHQIVCALGALELTNPLLQARWFLRTHGYHNTPIFYAVEFIFVSIFFTVRILFGTIYIFKLIFFGRTTWEYIVIVLLIYFMSWMFMINMAKYFYNRYTFKESRETDFSQIDTS